MQCVGDFALTGGQCTCDPPLHYSLGWHHCAACGDHWFVSALFVNCFRLIVRVCGCSLACTNTTCGTCEDGYPLRDAITSSCFSACPSGTYQSGSFCYPCNSTCATCFGPSGNECLSCSSSSSFPYFHMDENTCLAVIPVGMFCNLTNICFDCSTSCKTCSQAADTCTSCDISSSARYFDQLTSRCLDSAPAQQWCDPVTFVCDGLSAFFVSLFLLVNDGFVP